MDNLKKKEPQDGSEINLHEKYEVNSWCKKFGCTRVELQKAVKAVGNSSKEVKKYFESH
jgi:hypothetical protein